MELPGLIESPVRGNRGSATFSLGLAGAHRHGCAAVADRRGIVAICEQERLTRVRAAGFNSSGLPDEAVDAALVEAHADRAQIAACGISEFTDRATGHWPASRFDHHEAHAATAYLTSPFASAAVLICDTEAPGVSAWSGEGARLTRLEWPWEGPGPADLYAECAHLMGFTSEAGPKRFEALARTMAGAPDQRLPHLFCTDGGRIKAVPGWHACVESLLGQAGSGLPARARLAAALQAQVSGLVIDLLGRLRATTGTPSLCVGGSLFHSSSINSRVKLAGLYDRVFVPANPGNAGLAVGSAALLARLEPRPVSAFMGPSYQPDAIKAALDNCKLRYDWLSEGALVEQTVRHLRQGHLVGWFEGRMEWGPRALGARSILADPFAPFVLENLNTYLKRREPWRGYAVSVLADSAAEHFSGPDGAPFMECDYQPCDAARFRSVLPSESAHLRLHTVTTDSPPRFRMLLREFGEAAGAPCLVNTSFNGFHEPIVCTPRDAVRVFFGSGLDVLVLDQFMLTK